MNIGAETYAAVQLALTFICGFALLQGVVSLFEGVRSVRHLKTYRPKGRTTPRVVVFCPCKGVESGFRENIQSILNQDYPYVRVVFVVESAEDAAAAILQQESGKRPLIAGFAEARGQKVQNLIHAVEHAAGDAEIFVFCDSDARFQSDWIRNLIAPLESPDVAVATGYRWYAAESGRFPSLLRSIWNASAVTMLGAHDRNFAWGGSMALRRDVFDRIGVRGAWENALSDDFAVTRSARAAGMRIVFVPLCLIPSYGDAGWRDLLEFTTRQVIITRVYEPRMWRLAFFGQTVFNTAFWGGLLLPGWGKLVTLGLYLLSGIKSYVRYQGVAAVLPEGALSKQAASYILWAPLTALLFEYNLIRSALTRNITWQQVQYKLRSPDRTEVRRSRRRKLNTLIFFVTSHCNASCETCFYWEELNRPGDLNWSEIVKLSETMPQLTDLWFSGGEPTLRRDLEDIIQLFVSRNGVRHINLPTNGLKPARIHEIALRTLDVNPNLELHINIALDGTRDAHDAMRGVPGNFDKAIETARVLRGLKPRFGARLEVHFNTVLTRDNLSDIAPLAEWVFLERLVDGHYFNLIRGDAKDPGLKAVPREELRKLYPKLADLQKRYSYRLFQDRNLLVRWLMRRAYVGTLTFHHRTQFENLEGSHTWKMPCTAGETSAVVDFDGRVRACEMREPVGNLRENGMQFDVFWESPARKAETKQIACDKCWCSHVCFIHDSMRYSYKTMLLEVPKNYLMRKVW